MRSLILFSGVLLFVAGVCVAGERPACSNPAYDYATQDTDGLRRIAASCEQEAISELFYHRAYHAGLLAEAELLSQLIPYEGGRHETLVETHFLYMALVEELAKVWYPNLGERVAFLNDEYQLQNEVVELRLHGFDHLADHLVQKMVRR
ncbi:hypothetical protein ACFL0R_07740 [Pseudomonadota bacterium]